MACPCFHFLDCEVVRSTLRLAVPRASATLDMFQPMQVGEGNRWEMKAEGWVSMFVLFDFAAPFFFWRAIKSAKVLQIVHNGNVVVSFDTPHPAVHFMSHILQQGTEATHGNLRAGAAKFHALPKWLERESQN